MARGLVKSLVDAATCLSLAIFSFSMALKLDFSPSSELKIASMFNARGQLHIDLHTPILTTIAGLNEAPQIASCYFTLLPALVYIFVSRGYKGQTSSQDEDSQISNPSLFGDILSTLPACVALLLLSHKPSDISTKNSSKAHGVPWKELLATLLTTICFSFTWPGISLILVTITWSMWTSFAELCNPKNQVSVILTRHIIKTLLQISLIAICLFVAFGLVVPKSEITFGGNFNLRHLSASVRRSLRQAASLVPSPLDVHTDVSLYIRGAGFLQEEQGRLVAGDKIATMFPWQIRKPAFDDVTRERGRDPFIHAGDTVILQSPISSNYVSFSRIMTGNAGMVPVPFLSASMEDGRFVVEPAANLSSQSFWILQEAEKSTAGISSGVRFYNPVDDCHLATTFRSHDFSYGLTDDEAAASLAVTTTTTTSAVSSRATRPSAHKVHTEARAEAEAALLATFNRFHEIGCVCLPTLSASTFHIVDETRHTGTFGTNLSPPVLPLTLWAKEILVASVRMRYFARLDARNHVRGYTAADQRQYLISHTTMLGEWSMVVFLALFGVVTAIRAVLVKRKMLVSLPGKRGMVITGGECVKRMEGLCLLAIASRKLFIASVGAGAVDQSGVFLTCVASMGIGSVLVGFLG